MIFSTFLATYPASVSVVASAMVKGNIQNPRLAFAPATFLPRARGADQQDVGISPVDIARFLRVVQAFVVVVPPARTRLAFA